MALKRRVAEITTCSICHENYKSPRTLPCLHSFCLKCLQDHWKDKPPGAVVPCPVCRAAFQIPQKGLDSLKVNVDLENLVDAKNESAASSGLCEVIHQLTQIFAILLQEKTLKLLLRSFEAIGLFSLFLNILFCLCTRHCRGDQALLAIFVVFELLGLCSGYPVFSSDVRSICVICLGWLYTIWTRCKAYSSLFNG